MTSTRTAVRMLRTDGSWLVAANACRYAAQAAVLVAVTTTLGSTTAGAYVLALAITTPLFSLAEMGLRTVYLTLRAQVAFLTYVTAQTASLSLALGATVLLAVVVPGVDAATLLCVAAIKAADALGNLACGPFQRHNRTRHAGIAVMVNAAATLAVAPATIALTGSLIAGLIVSLLMSLVTTVALLLVPAVRLTREHDPEHGGQAAHARQVLGAGASLGVSQALLSLIATIPQYALAATASAHALTLYALLGYCVVVVHLLLQPLGQAWLPVATEEHARSGESGVHRLLWSTFFQWSASVLVVTALVLLAALALFPFVFGDAFSLSAGLLLPVGATMLAAPAIFLGEAVLSVQNRYSSRLLVGLSSVVVSGALSVLVIPSYGLGGALWVSAGVNVLRGCLALGLVRKGWSR